MQRLFAISFSFLFSLLLLAACENASAPVPGPADEKGVPGAAILGIEWVQQRNPDVIAYAGSSLTLTLAGDSAVLIEENYTDMIECRIMGADTLCSSGRWKNRYVGSYAMDDSLLTLSLTFAGTTAKNATRNDPVASSVTVSEYAWDAGNPSNLELTGVGDGDVFPGRKSLRFEAKPKTFR